MSSFFRPSAVTDQTQLIQFLARVFSVGQGAPFLEPSLLRWKYWESRSDWPGPRSFVLERDGRLVAHAGIWPVTVQSGGKLRAGVHMIDWASDPRMPGAGVALLQRLTRTYDFVYSIGGSAMTQSILPKFGFRCIGDALTMARPIRPWRQMLRHQSRDLRLPLRLARNIWWFRAPRRALDHGWAAVESAGGVAQSGIVAQSGRGEPFFEYLRKCPSVRCLSFDVLNHGRRAGFFALTIAGDQARVAGVWMEDPSPANWRTALLLAQETALAHTVTSEIAARCLTESSAEGAAHAGFRLRARTPVFLFRKAGESEPLPLEFQFADNDAVFLREESAGFLT